MFPALDPLPILTSRYTLAILHLTKRGDILLVPIWTVVDQILQNAHQHEAEMLRSREKAIDIPETSKGISKNGALAKQVLIVAATVA